MTEYTDKIQELDTKVEVLAIQLKEARAECDKIIKALRVVVKEQKQLREKDWDKLNRQQDDLLDKCKAIRNYDLCRALEAELKQMAKESEEI